MKKLSPKVAAPYVELVSYTNSIACSRTGGHPKIASWVCLKIYGSTPGHCRNVETDSETYHSYMNFSKNGGTPQNLNVCWESNEFPNHRRNVGFLSSSWDALFRFVDAAMRYVTELNEKCGSKLSLKPQRTGDIFVMG